MVQQREKRMGRNPATGARVEIPAKQVVKASHHEATQGRGRIVDYSHASSRSGGVVAVLGQYGRNRNGVEPWPASRSTLSSTIPSLRPFLS